MVAAGAKGADETAGPPVGAGAAQAHAQAAEGTRAGRARPSLLDRAKALLAWWKQTRPARANARFGAVGGGVLTGGIAYAALFSVFAGLTIGYTVFMAVLGKNEALRQDVLDALNSSLPGLVDTGDGSGGLIDPDALQLSAALTVTGIVALVVLVLSALSATAALRTGVRAMFGSVAAGNAVMGKLREAAGFAGMALAVLLSAVLTTATTSAADWLFTLVDWQDASGFAVRALGVLVAFVVDAAMFLLVVWVLADERPAWRDLLGGAVIAAVGIGVVRVLGTSVVAGSASKNPLLASFAVIVTLLVWINLIARIVLLASAWTANPPLEEPDAEPATA